MTALPNLTQVPSAALRARYTKVCAVRRPAVNSAGQTDDATIFLFRRTVKRVLVEVTRFHSGAAAADSRKEIPNQIKQPPHGNTQIEESSVRIEWNSSLTGARTERTTEFLAYLRLGTSH